MLDAKYIRDNLEAVKINIRNRFVEADADAVVELYEKRNRLLNEIDTLRQDRNENAKRMKGKMDQEQRSALIAEGKRLKDTIASLEKSLLEVQDRLDTEIVKIPNMAHPDVPVGKEDKDNTEIERIGTIPQFSFPARDHLTLGQELNILDFETATRVSGPKFYYLLNEGAILEMALSRFAMDFLKERGFTLIITPDIAREEIVEGIGFNPRGQESNIYTIEGTGTCLVGTSEITLGGYHAGEILNAEDLPVKLAGLSHCFRREAGAAGKYSKGLYRVHQFTKVEMFIFCHPDESEKIHDELLTIEKDMFKALEIPFRVVDTCTGDLGNPAYRKYDLEAWMPGRGEKGDWGEITSTSNCTDYQARRLQVRFREDGKNRHVHLVNGTGIANSRAIIAILENHQKEDGSVRIPEKLVPYTGFTEIKPKKT